MRFKETPDFSYGFKNWFKGAEGAEQKTVMSKQSSVPSDRSFGQSTSITTRRRRNKEYIDKNILDAHDTIEDSRKSLLKTLQLLKNHQTPIRDIDFIEKEVVKAYDCLGRVNIFLTSEF